MANRAQAVPALSAEFDGADLGDERLDQRLGLLADSVAERPGESFPKALDDAELEAAYRFFRNERVTPEGILAPHFRQTARRAAADWPQRDRARSGYDDLGDIRGNPFSLQLSKPEQRSDSDCSDCCSGCGQTHRPGATGRRRSSARRQSLCDLPVSERWALEIVRRTASLFGLACGGGRAPDSKG